MKWLRKEGTSGKNVPILLLLAAGIIEFLFITLESSFSYIGYYLAENYLIVPCLLFLGYVLREKPSQFAGRRLLLAVAAIAWFVLVQIIHALSGMGTHRIATVFFVYLMAFPFAALAEDRDDAGLWWIGGVFVAASLVLVGYSVLLLLDAVPEGMQELLYWDGARLHAFWHPNLDACYFMIGIGFSAAFCVRAEKLWVKLLLLAAIILQFLAMALTNCRTTLLVTGALLGGALFFLIAKGGWRRFLLGLLAALVLLVGSFKFSGMVYRWNNARLIASYAASQEETESSEESAAEESAVVEEEGIILGNNQQGSLKDDMRTLNGRTFIWKSALSAVRDDRSLALWGTEYAGTVISAYNWFPVVHAHNSWMEALMRMGIPGLLLSLAFTVLSVWSAVKLIFRKGVEIWKKVIVMLTMCLLAAGFLEPYLFITNVYYHVMDFAFFFCTGYLDYWCRPKQLKDNE